MLLTSLPLAAFWGQEHYQKENAPLLARFFSIRAGKWKYTPHLGSGGFSLPQRIHLAADEPTGTIFNLEDDPDETRNLYEQYPGIVEELSSIV